MSHLQVNTLSSRTFFLAVALSFTAYPLVAVISAELSLNNFLFSAIVRIALVALAVFIILNKSTFIHRQTSQWLLLATIVIWLAYLARMAWDTFYRSDQLGQSPEFYWMWALGGCFIPMIALAKQPRRDEVWITSFMVLFIGASISAILVAFTASGQMEDAYGLIYESGRFRIGNTLNPIAIGNIGALLLTQASWYLMYQERSSRRFGTVVPMLLVAAGTYILLVGNSRGPLLAAVCCLLIMVIALRTRKKLVAILVLAAAAVLLSPAMLYVEKVTGIAVYSRVFGQSILDQAESSMRLTLYNSALQITESSPLIGASIEDPWTKSYPHNVFIELYMASGIFAAAGLFIIFTILTVRAIRLLEYRSASSWAGVLFLQFLVGAQVSSAFYSNGYLWCAVGLLIAAQPTPPLQRQEFGQEGLKS